MAYGTVAGILVSTPRPLLYSSVSGVQWFCAGSTYFCMFGIRVFALNSPLTIRRLS